MRCCRRSGRREKKTKKKLKILNKLAPLKLVCDPPTDTGQKRKERCLTLRLYRQTDAAYTREPNMPLLVWTVLVRKGANSLWVVRRQNLRRLWNVKKILHSSWLLLLTTHYRLLLFNVQKIEIIWARPIRQLASFCSWYWPVTHLSVLENILSITWWCVDLWGIIRHNKTLRVICNRWIPREVCCFGAQTSL